MRLRIIHWLIWVFFSVVLFVCYRFGSPEATTLSRLFAAEHALIDGAIFSAALALIGCQRRGAFDPASLQPGHWIVVQMAVSKLLQLILFAVAQCMAQFEFSLGVSMMIAGAIFATLPIFIWLIAIWYFWRQTNWRLFFFFEAFAAVFNLGYLAYFGSDSSTSRMINSLPDIVGGLPFLLLWIAVVIDTVREDYKRDWIHWAGVIVYAAEYLFRVIFNTVGWRLFIPMG